MNAGLYGGFNALPFKVVETLDIQVFLKCIEIREKVLG